MCPCLARYLRRAGTAGDTGSQNATVKDSVVWHVCSCSQQPLGRPLMMREHRQVHLRSGARFHKSLGYSIVRSTRGVSGRTSRTCGAAGLAHDEVGAAYRQGWFVQCARGLTAAVYQAPSVRRRKSAPEATTRCPLSPIRS